MKKVYFLLLGFMAVNMSLWACNVPVFRYALERWPASPYVAVIIADKPLTSDEKQAMEMLEKASDGSSGNLNLLIRHWTTERLSESTLANHIPDPVKGNGAQIHLLFPVAMDELDPIWSGSLTEENVKKIIGSPARQELVKKILEGNSGVYILLESGNRTKDEEAANSLNAYLTSLSSELGLPRGVVEFDGSVTGDGMAGDDPINQLRSGIPFKIAFSLLRLPVKGADEILYSVLKRLTKTKNLANNEPMAFAVYGRGRALQPIVGEEITLDMVGQISAFLVGACSCQVKDLNPGTDLLLNHDWDRSVFSGGY
jgi:hypothetical protein